MGNAEARSWWSLELGDGVLALEACHHIKERFDSLYAAGPRSLSLAVFTAQVEADLHCRVLAYFPPDCAQLALQLDAAPCTRPARAGLELLIGDAASWQAWFAPR